MDDASYVQQSWGSTQGGSNNEQIKEILTQFTNTQEIRNLQRNLFGCTDKSFDPILQTPSLSSINSISQNNNQSLTGKRGERPDEVEQQSSKK